MENTEPPDNDEKKWSDNELLEVVKLGTRYTAVLGMQMYLTEKKKAVRKERYFGSFPGMLTAICLCGLLMSRGLNPVIALFLSPALVSLFYAVIDNTLDLVFNAIYKYLDKKKNNT